MGRMSGLPVGFARHEQDGASLVLRTDDAPALLAAGLADPEACRERAVAEYRGRGRPFGLDVPDVGRVFVRRYVHGGVLGHLTADRHAGDGRFEEELAALTAAQDAGVPVPEALGVVSRATGLGLRRGWLLLREISGAEDVLAVLCDTPEPAQRRRVLAASGRAMRRLHDAGIDHPDLHLKNLLRTPDGDVLVLDLDRSRVRAELARERRLAGLFRFDRYAAKQARRGLPVSRIDRLRVLRAYAGSDWPGRAELRQLAARLARHIARHGVLRREAAAR